MNTAILKESEISKAAKIIRSGGLVAIPTETVYGLAANALDGKAVSKIFVAKGRPMDNPLIVHIASVDDIENLVSEFPEKAHLLAKHFWPGPLTMILPKSKIIPDEVSAGLETVAVRFPSNKTAQKIIAESGVPLAAPSANSSGYPSPTEASHVKEDLFGKIDAIVDGGKCNVGVESTVITLASDVPRLLRPGAVTLEQIKDVIGEVEVDKAICNRLDEGEKVISPGMKYKHYSPLAKVILVKGSDDAYIKYVNSLRDKKNVFALCFDEDVKSIKIPCVSYGESGNSEEQANKLFSCLRELDKLNAKLVYARCPKENGVGLAVYNRLIRAAGFEVMIVE